MARLSGFVGLAARLVAASHVVAVGGWVGSGMARHGKVR
jgi:hypothetical protein